MKTPSFESVKNSVKLVIWDLDETFWKGTLSEEGIEPITAHIEMIRTLVDRGIMCSICSKNDFSQAKAAVEKLGIWDLFVFPQIAWAPKGQAIAKMVQDMGLRDENVVFLDDNHLNLEEAQFFNPNLMVVEAVGDMTGLLALPEMQGKDDSKHSRLAQYKVMEQKQTEQVQGGLSNTEFLKQSGIKIKIITDIESHMDRVLEILNRTNQLNFTKERANTPEERAALDELLRVPGVHAGLIHAQDRYGDYGIVGFFCVRTRYSGTTVQHFAFSCRTLNMGVEQWVWEYLGKPEVPVRAPVANPVQSFETVDWITEVTDFDAEDSAVTSRHLCLVGGCDMQQVSFYCGAQRDEFVNTQDEGGMLVRYDDIGFFLNPRDVQLKHSRPLKEYVGYSLEDMQALDLSLASTDLILLSLFFSVPGDNLFTFGGKAFGGEYWGTIPPARLRALMQKPDVALAFAKQMFHRRVTMQERLDLTRQCFEHANRLRRPETPLFLVGATSNFGPQAERNPEVREAYNAMCKAFCADTPGAIFIEPNTLLSAEDVVDSDHYTRTGYFKIAKYVNDHADSLNQSATPVAQTA